MSTLNARPWNAQPRRTRRAQGSDLGVPNVHAGGAATVALHTETGQHINHGLFDQGDQFAHADAEAADVHQGVSHDLPGPVIGHLAAPVDLDYRNIARRQHVLGSPGLALGEHRRVLHQPQLVTVCSSRESVNACMARQTGSYWPAQGAAA